MRTRLWAALSCPISGITFTRAMTSPSRTVSPARLTISEMMPRICGLMFTSSRGSMAPVTTVTFCREVRTTVSSSYSTVSGRDFFHRCQKVPRKTRAMAPSTMYLMYFFISSLFFVFSFVPHRIHGLDLHRAGGRCQPRRHAQD